MCSDVQDQIGFAANLGGFPQITLRGTKNDWILLKKKLEAILKQKVLKEFGVKWAEAVMPIIDRFIAAYDGDIDCLFWNSMLRRGAARPSRPGISARTDISKRSEKFFYSGWFNIFFPLINPTNRNGNEGKFADNPHCVAYSDSNDYVTCGVTGGAYGMTVNVHNIFFNPSVLSVFDHITIFDFMCCTDLCCSLHEYVSSGPKMEQLPSGISSAPVEWIDEKEGKNYDLKFVAGFIGCSQDEKTLEVSPKIGWLISEK